MKLMIKISVLFFICACSASIFPQPWQLQSANVSSDAVVAPFSPVNNEICWASWSTGWVSSSDYINGYLRTTDGGMTWVCDTIPEIENGMIWWIDGIDENIAYMAVESWSASGMQGIYKTTDGGTTWQKHPGTYSNSVYGPAYIHFFDINNGVAVGEVDPNTFCLEIYTTTNGGLDWNLVPSSNIPPSVSAEFLEPVQVAEYGDCVWVPTIGTGGPHLYKTTDKGYTWSLIDIPGTNDDYMMFAAFQNEINGMRVVWQWSQAAAALEKTTDGGTNWTLVPGPYADCIPLNVSYVPGTSAGYVITGDVNVNGYAGGSAYTLDNGNTWTNLDNGNYCYMVFTDYAGWATNWVTNNFYKYVGPPWPIPVELSSFTASVSGSEVSLIWSTATETNNKGFEVQRSKSEMTEWMKVGIVNGKGTTTEKQQYSFVDKNVPAGTYIYRLKQTDFNGSSSYSEEVSVEVKSVFTYFLEQNYPNPFNPSTLIKFGLKEKSNVRIELFNTLGEKVRTILNDTKDAGNFTLEFNAADLPSGVYLYQVTAGSFTSVKKMILLK